MKYLVLYQVTLKLAHNHFLPQCEGDYTRYELSDVNVALFKAFTGKKEAIEFAKSVDGEIVEAFEWDIKKEAKK